MADKPIQRNKKNYRPTKKGAGMTPEDCRYWQGKTRQ